MTSGSILSFQLFGMLSVSMFVVLVLVKVPPTSHVLSLIQFHDLEVPTYLTIFRAFPTFCVDGLLKHPKRNASFYKSYVSPSGN